MTDDSTKSSDTNANGPVMDVDSHVVDEGYSTQMDVDSHAVENSSDGGARLEEPEGGQLGESTSGPESPGGISISQQPPSGSSTVSASQHDTHNSGSSPQLSSSVYHEATDVAEPSQAVSDSGDAQDFTMPSFDNFVVTATVEFHSDSDGEDYAPSLILADLIASTSQNPPPPDIALPQEIDTPPNISPAETPLHPHIPFNLFDSWDFLNLVPDRGHIHSVSRFLWNWKAAGQIFDADHRIDHHAFLPSLEERPSFLFPEVVAKYEGDVQAIAWSWFGTTRRKARAARRRLYCIQNSMQNRCSLCCSNKGKAVREGEKFFRFRQLSTRHIPTVEHWQLRHLITATSQNDIYYASGSKLMHMHPLSSKPLCVADLSNPVSSTALGAGFNTTTLTAGDGFLVAGSFQGEYALVDLTAEQGARTHKGVSLSSDFNRITNHVHLFLSRGSGRTQAFFASNDCRLRTLDCNTNKFTSITSSELIVNCAATSPDGRLRVQVGDFPGSTICDVDSGRVVKWIAGNTGDSFACAWSDDGVTVAVAGQDSHVLVFDARRWGDPIADIACELDCTRSLQFSPAGSGRRVLVAAESADFVNVIDATTFTRKQTIDFFGNIAGACMSADGSELLIANADQKVGGIFSYRRTDHAGDLTGGSWVGGGCGSDWTSYEKQQFDPTVCMAQQQRLWPWRDDEPLF